MAQLWASPAETNKSPMYTERTITEVRGTHSFSKCRVFNGMGRGRAKGTGAEPETMAYTFDAAMPEAAKSGHRACRTVGGQVIAGDQTPAALRSRYRADLRAGAQLDHRRPWMASRTQTRMRRRTGGTATSFWRRSTQPRGQRRFGVLEFRGDRRPGEMEFETLERHGLLSPQERRLVEKWGLREHAARGRVCSMESLQQIEKEN